MDSMYCKAILAAALVFGLLASPASALERTVNCDKGQSIQDALDTGPAALRGRYTVAINGICREDVTIRRPMVTIDGNIGPTGPAIEGTIRVFAGDTRIQFLTVTGPGRGILVSGGQSSARVNHVNLIQNDGVGLEVVGGAFVFLANSTVSGNDSGVVVSWSVLHIDNDSHVMNNADAGVLALDGSHVTIANSEVSVHPGTGISLWNSSSALLNNANVSANANGIEMRAGSIRIGEGTAINGNLNHGIDANLHSSVQIENASIYNNDGSGIRLEYDSGLLGFDNVDIHSNAGGNIVCGDLESSAVFLSAAPSEVLCTDYNQEASSP